MNLKKIIFIVYNIYGIGGTVRTTALFANALVNRDHRVSIISLRYSKKRPKIYIDEKIEIINITKSERNLTEFIVNTFMTILRSRLFDKSEDLYFNLNRLIDRELFALLSSIDEGIVVGTMPSINRLIAKLFSNKKNVFTVGQEHKGFKDHSEGIQKLIVENYGDLDSLTVLTDSNLEVYAKYNNNIYSVGNSTISIPYSSRLNSKKIIMIGRLVPQKGYVEIIKYFSRGFFTKNKDYTIEIYGNGKLHSKIKNEILKYNLEDKILLKGEVTNIYPYLLGAEVFLLPSLYEPFGMVLIEAMSCGLPVVSYSTEGPVEIISENGLLADIGDGESFVSCVDKIINDENLKKNMSKKSKNIVEDKYIIDNFVDRWLSEIVK